MYTFLLRSLPVPLANLIMALWYGGLLMMLWLKLPDALGVGFRYGQI